MAYPDGQSTGQSEAVPETHQQTSVTTPSMVVIWCYKSMRLTSLRAVAMGYKVLYIEDNQNNMQLVRKLLRQTDYHLLEAADAKTGLEIAKQELPDLILLNIGLSDERGLESISRFKTVPPLAQIPVVALTADTSHETFQRCMEAGCAGFLNKPISRFVLLDTLRRYLPSVPLQPTIAQKVSQNYKSMIESGTYSPLKQVLIAEDRPDLRKIFGHVFNKQHFNVRMAADGIEALEALRIQTPDILVLDINMPNLSGLEVLTYVRQQQSLKDIKVIVVTGNSLAVQYPEVGSADLFLVKPVNLSELVTFAQRLLVS